MTMNGILHPRGNVGRLNLEKKEEGRALISFEKCEWGSAELGQVC